MGVVSIRAALTMHALSPPLSVIETDLFAPSDALIARWARADPTLSAEVVARLEADPAARARREAFQAEIPAGVHVSAETATIAMPGFLKDLVQRRVAARQARFSPKPKPGQIWRIEAPTGPAGTRLWDLARPLAVLIAAPTGRARIWCGWLVSPETDYASDADMLLEPEDEPFDPLAGMVQLWNPVRIALPETGRILAEIARARLAAAWAMAAEVQTQAPRSPIPDHPGLIAPRNTREGYRVLTGTPLGPAPEDPRHGYRALYLAAAQAVGKGADMSEAEGAATGVERTLASLRAWAEAQQLGWRAQPAVAHAMGETDFDYVLAGRLRLTFIERAVRGRMVLELHLRLEGDEPLEIARLERGRTLWRRSLDSDAPTADLRLAGARPCTLEVRDRSGRLLFAIPFLGSL